MRKETGKVFCSTGILLSGNGAQLYHLFFAYLEILLCKAKSNWPQIFSFQDKSSAIAVGRVSEQYGVASLHFFLDFLLSNAMFEFCLDILKSSLLFH